MEGSSKSSGNSNSNSNGNGNSNSNSNSNSNTVALRVVESWSLSFAGSEIARVAAPPAEEAVFSPARTIGDDSLLMKYLNPNLIAVATTARAPAAAGGATATAAAAAAEGRGEGEGEGEGGEESSAQGVEVFLVDATTGRVLNRVSHATGTGPVHLLRSENWCIYSFFDRRSKRTEVSSLALYGAPIGKWDLSPIKMEAARKAREQPLAEAEPYVLQRAFAFPQNVLALAATQTGRGITTKNILVAYGAGQVLRLQRKWFDPRRPKKAPGPAEIAEGLQQYQPYLPLMQPQVVSYNKAIPFLREVVSAPVTLESISLVFGIGLDLFQARVSPSHNNFDMLADDFNYGLLIILTIAMAVATGVANRAVKKKKLQTMWK